MKKYSRPEADSRAIETLRPDAGFKLALESRSATTGESRIVPARSDDEMAAGYPFEENPCLHRTFAQCRDEEDFLRFASRYGLLTVTVPPSSENVSPRANIFASGESVGLWVHESEALRRCADLWDAITANKRAVLARLLGGGGASLRERALDEITRIVGGKLGRHQFEARVTLISLTPIGISIEYRPPDLLAAIWQRFADEVSGQLICRPCESSNCDKWMCSGRADRIYCSKKCKQRVWRRGPNRDVRK